MSRLGSMLELLFFQQLRGTPLERDVVRELEFAKPERLWRFDFAWPDELVAVELEGGTWVEGAHGRGKHFESDCEKYNEAGLRGWRVFRFTTDQVEDGRAIAFMQRVFAKQGSGSVATG